ncbi:MAG: hypothetical protein IJ700_08830 [Bacteroidaceae bacterium]|nr:hypothetical protein [Bacteroidaceae bacterium]MBR1683435.1 hypothetical protein [Bacteroidaceae bacterium]
MNYVIKDRCIRNIASFYHYVAQKYSHTYSAQMMHKNLDDAMDAMFLIEQSLLRRRPTLRRWQEQGWHMAKAGSGSMPTPSPTTRSSSRMRATSRTCTNPTDPILCLWCEDY